MHAERTPPSQLRDLALEQTDLVTVRQAHQANLPKDAVSRITSQGYWRRLASGLYDTAPDHDTVMKSIWAAALQAGEPYAIGGDAALLLHGLDRRVERVTVWVPDDRRPRPRSEARFRRDKIGRVGRALGSPRRIRIEDAIIDVGQQLPLERLVALLSDSVRIRATTVARVQTALDQRRRVRHRVDFGDILNDLTGIESNLEYVYREAVERAHGLPAGTRQVSMSAGTRTDVVYDDQALLVELDGRLGHEDAASTFRDLRRDNAHALGDLITLRYGSADVRAHPCEVARQVWLALRRHGWVAPLLRCPRCNTRSS